MLDRAEISVSTKPAILGDNTLRFYRVGAGSDG
jgi:hypothetical protein